MGGGGGGEGEERGWRGGGEGGGGGRRRADLRVEGRLGRKEGSVVLEEGDGTRGQVDRVKHGGRRHVDR